MMRAQVAGTDALTLWYHKQSLKKYVIMVIHYAMNHHYAMNKSPPIPATLSATN